jgi:hypothetical protein
LSAAPAHLKNPGRLAAQLGCQQLLIPMWACLVKDALAQHAIQQESAEGRLPPLLESLRTQGDAWTTAAESYRQEFGIAPCLAELVKCFFKS